MALPTNDPSNYVAIAVQPSKDSEGSTFYFLKHLADSGFDIETDIQEEREGGDGQEVGLRYPAALSADGALHANSRPGWAGRSWAWALGGEVVISTASPLHRHVAFPRASLPYLTLDQRAPQDLIERVTNAKVTKLTEEWEAGRPLKIHTDFISGGSSYRRSTASALTVTRESTIPFSYVGASAVLRVSDGAGGEASSIKMTKGRVEVSRGVDDDIRTTGLNREDVSENSFDANLEGTLRYEDVTLYRNVYYGAGTQVIPDLATGSFNLYSAKGSYNHELIMPLLDITSMKITRLDPDGKTVYADFRAETRKSATHAITAVTHTPDPTAYLLSA